MSHEPSHVTEHLPPPPAQAIEGIAWAKVLGVGIGAVIIFTIAVWVMTDFMNAREKRLQPLGPAATPIQIGEVEVGIVDQVPFDVTRTLQSYRRDRLDRLEHWGWVDRKAGIVHMPIGEAMDLVVKEQAK